MARTPAAEEAGVYRAAELFVDRCLKADDSLFTPGVAVWSAEVIEDLHRCFVLVPDFSKAKWDEKFPKQLAKASSPLTVQLAGEALYVHFLFARDIGGAKKREVIDAALACTQAPVSMPADLAQLLDTGIAKTGAAFGVGRPQYLAYLVEFARHWKSLRVDDRSAALSNPWQFKKVAYAVEAPGALGQREALLHLAFPDDFESMLSAKHKSSIVAYFSEAPGDATDVDERLAEIRAHLTPASGEFVNFYSPELQRQWQSSEPPGGSEKVDDPERIGSRTWWVNQGETYNEGRAGGYLWAPKANKNGGAFVHWTNMTRLQVGDVVVHYANTAIRALSVVQATAVDAEKPGEITGQPWEEDGWLVSVAPRDLSRAVLLTELPETVRAAGAGPFTTAGGVKQGYLWEVPSDMGQALREFFGDEWPHSLIPAERGRQGETGERGHVKRHPIYQHIAEKGFAFPDWLVTDYLLSLGTKPFVLLSGISGTGKTKMAQLVAECVSPDTAEATSAPPELELGDGEFILRVTTSSLVNLGYMIPTSVASRFTRPQKGGGYDVPVTLDGLTAVAHVNNIAYHPTTGESTGLQLSFHTDFSDWLKKQGAGAGDVLRVRIDQAEPLNLSVVLVPSARTRTPKERPRVAFISVRADWTDNRSMLGYYNPLTEQYVPTELLRLLLHAAAHPDEPHFAILDEMNLAKVEYYFSDFLSAMESGTELVLHDAGEAVTAEIGGEELPIPERLRVPANLLFTGTVNVDETTFMFSPKVLDRANVMQFHAVDLKGYFAGVASSQGSDGFALSAAVDLERLLRPAPARRDDYLALDSASRRCLETMNELLAAHHLHFGYRVANEVARYLGLAKAFLGDSAVPRALDLQIQQKILPKFVGNRAKLEQPLWELLTYLQTGELEARPLTAAALAEVAVGDAEYPESVAALARMLQTLRQVGFASFIE